MHPTRTGSLPRCAVRERSDHPLCLTVLMPSGNLQGTVNLTLQSLAIGIAVPRELVILVDSRAHVEFDRGVLNILKHRGTEVQVVYDTNTTSIFGMQRRLLGMCGANQAVFVDDDAVLRWDALAMLAAAAAGNPLFVEGMRVEVGGRDQDRSGPELKASANIRGSGSIDHGDTFLLLHDVAALREASRHPAMAFWDQDGMPGSDFAMTMLARARHPGRRAYCCRDAIGYHLARPDRGYWRNFASVDAYMRTQFAAAVDGVEGERIGKFVANIYGQ